MKRVALSLLVSTVLAAIAGTVQAQDIKPDIKKGQESAAMCIGCHGIPGYQSSFPEVHRVPMIAGQNAKYIVSALNAYKKGERKHPTMRGIAAPLSDEEMANLAAFYEQQGASMVKTVSAAPAPSAEVDALLKKGVCASCHGENLNKPIDPGYPKIAGQHADYLFVALKSYKIEGNPQVGRGNAIMAAQMKQFTPAELRVLAKYIGSLPGDLHTVRQNPFR